MRRIAEGGMATIYLATSQGPGGFEKPCVIKRIKPQFSASPDFRGMLVKEAKVAALLSHPNVVQVFDFGEVGGEYYLTMEWVEGTALSRLMAVAYKRGVAVGLRAAVEVGLAMASALDYIASGVLVDGQRVNVVHRDVTPSNILVSTTGAIKLTDFGIVKVLEAPSSTKVGVIKGKYAYMSPEQIKGQELDTRSDLFSLGVVLYEMVTGRRLFRRPDMASSIAAVLSGHVPPVRQIDPSIPVAFEQILSKLLAKKRDERYGSAAELLEVLTQFSLSPEASSRAGALTAWVQEASQTPLRSASQVVDPKDPNGAAAQDFDDDELGEAVQLRSDPLAFAALDQTIPEGPASPATAPVAAMATGFPERAQGGAGTAPWLIAAVLFAAIVGSIAFWAILFG
ncbi:MAG: serine/threonine protein kinase [Deltaproteobacteria bacterium]|nr:serine/threonine protein kinase [Deltaproteobacteria bacterium]